MPKRGAPKGSDPPVAFAFMAGNEGVDGALKRAGQRRREYHDDPVGKS